jgi:hypothetical protein
MWLLPRTRKRVCHFPPLTASESLGRVLVKLRDWAAPEIPVGYRTTGSMHRRAAVDQKRLSGHEITVV